MPTIPSPSGMPPRMGGSPGCVGSAAGRGAGVRDRAWTTNGGKKLPRTVRHPSSNSQPRQKSLGPRVRGDDGENSKLHRKFPSPAASRRPLPPRRGDLSRRSPDCLPSRDASRRERQSAQTPPGVMPATSSAPIIPVAPIIIPMMIAPTTPSPHRPATTRQQAGQQHGPDQINRYFTHDAFLLAGSTLKRACPVLPCATAIRRS